MFPASLKNTPLSGILYKAATIWQFCYGEDRELTNNAVMSMLLLSKNIFPKTSEWVCVMMLQNRKLLFLNPLTLRFDSAQFAES